MKVILCDNYYAAIGEPARSLRKQDSSYLGCIIGCLMVCLNECVCVTWSTMICCVVMGVVTTLLRKVGDCMALSSEAAEMELNSAEGTPINRVPNCCSDSTEVIYTHTNTIKYISNSFPDKVFLKNYE